MNIFFDFKKVGGGEERLGGGESADSVTAYFKRAPLYLKKGKIEEGVSFIRGVLWNPIESKSNYAMYDDFLEYGTDGNYHVKESFEKWSHARSADGEVKTNAFLDDKYTHPLDEKHAVTAALGLFGYSFGYEYTLNEKVKLGGMFGQDLLYANDGYLVGKANYYFSGVNSNGFYWGASAGFKEDVCVWCGQKNSDTKEIQSTGGIHFGYQF